MFSPLQKTQLPGGRHPSNQSHTEASIFPALEAAVGYRLKGPTGTYRALQLLWPPTHSPERAAPLPTTLPKQFYAHCSQLGQDTRLRPPRLPLEKSHAMIFLKPIVSSLPLAYSTAHACSQKISISALWPVERLVRGLML